LRPDLRRTVVFWEERLVGSRTWMSVRRVLVAVLLALVLVPSAGAWSRLTPFSLPNTVRPAVGSIAKH
jgi:hypothetical protein